MLISLCGSAVIFWCVHKAPWAYSDSAGYVAAARNLAAGLGLTYFHPDGSLLPLSVFAPLHPMLLSIFALIKVDLVLASQIINVLFFFGFIFLSGYLFHRVTNSKFLAICSTVILASCLPLVDNFSGMMSEPLAFLTGYTGFLLLLLFLIKGPPKYLYLSAILCGASFLTRYAFASFPLAALIVLIAFMQAPWRKKIRSVFFYGLISFGPMGLWQLHQVIRGVSVGGRLIGMNESIAARFLGSFKYMFDVFKFWLPYHDNLIPGLRAHYVRPLLLVLFFLLVASGLVLAIVHRRKKPEVREPFVVTVSALIWLFTYLLVFETFYMLASFVHFDTRLLSPMLPAMFFCLLAAVWLVGRFVKRRDLFIIIVGSLLAAAFFFNNLGPLLKYGAKANNYPPGYAGRPWRGDVLFDKVALLPTGTALISNAPDILLFFSNRNAYPLTRASFLDPGQFDVYYDTTLAEMMEERCSLLVLLDTSQVRNLVNMTDPIAEAEFVSAFSQYEVVFADEDGGILKSPSCPDIVLPTP